MGVERFRFDGKRCIVTGAASGMGRATAELLVELGGEVQGSTCDRWRWPIWRPR